MLAWLWGWCVRRNKRDVCVMCWEDSCACLTSVCCEWRSWGCECVDSLSCVCIYILRGWGYRVCVYEQLMGACVWVNACRKLMWTCKYLWQAGVCLEERWCVGFCGYILTGIWQRATETKRKIWEMNVRIGEYPPGRVELWKLIRWQMFPGKQT